MAAKPQRPQEIQTRSIWEITQDETANSVNWVDADNPRFAIYDPNGDNTDNPTTWEDELVLDKQTGLVWETSPDTVEINWFQAQFHCYTREVANRKGWLLPTVEELASLVDNDNLNPALPDDHPFNSVTWLRYWSSTTHQTDTDEVWIVEFYYRGMGYWYKSESDLSYV